MECDCHQWAILSLCCHLQSQAFGLKAVSVSRDGVCTPAIASAFQVRKGEDVGRAKALPFGSARPPCQLTTCQLTTSRHGVPPYWPKQSRGIAYLQEGNATRSFCSVVCWFRYTFPHPHPQSEDTFIKKSEWT